MKAISRKMSLEKVPQLKVKTTVFLRVRINPPWFWNTMQTWANIQKRAHRNYWYPPTFFTARKRSLGQGNIFIGVCQEFCSQGVSGPGGSDLGGCLVPGGLLPGGVCSWGSAPRGVPGPRGWWWRHPWRLLLRVVCILLECTLVWNAYGSGTIFLPVFWSAPMTLHEKFKVLFTPSRSECQSKIDQRNYFKHQGKCSLSPPFALGVNGPKRCETSTLVGRNLGAIIP